MIEIFFFPVIIFFIFFFPFFFFFLSDVRDVRASLPCSASWCSPHRSGRFSRAPFYTITSRFTDSRVSSAFVPSDDRSSALSYSSANSTPDPHPHPSPSPPPPPPPPRFNCKAARWKRRTSVQANFQECYLLSFEVL